MLVQWAEFDAAYQYSDGMLLYFKGELNETYVRDHIVPTLEASKFKPVSNKGETTLPTLYVLPWRGEAASKADSTYVILVNGPLGARDAVAQGGDPDKCLLKQTTIFPEYMVFIGIPEITQAGLTQPAAPYVYCVRLHSSPRHTAPRSLLRSRGERLHASPYILGSALRF